MSGVSRARRFAVAALALGISSALFRSQVAQALVIRGDEYLYRGESSQALRRYRMAASISPDTESAADHFVFVSLMRRTGTDLDAAVGVADGFLRRHPSDSTLLEDRGLCLLIQRRYAGAERDFEHAAMLSRSAGRYVFAGWAARRAGHAGRAAQLWRDALRLDASNLPARHALRALGQ